MSASREKKKRQEILTNGGDPRAAREAEQKAKEKKSKILYTTLGILFVVATVFLLVYNSGVIQRSKTAVTIDGEEYNVADMSYYYNNAYQNFRQSQTGYMAISFGMLDPNKPLSAQPAFGNPDQTWADFFKESAVANLKFTHAAAKAAEAEGLALGEEEQKILDDTIEGLKAAAKEAGYSYKAYISAVFGPTVTPGIFEKNMKQGLLASMYADKYSDSLSFSDEDIQSYYDEHKNDFDFVDGAYVAISGIPEAKTDDEGKKIEATDEEKAAAMADAKKKAEEMLADLKSGETLTELAEKAELTCIASDEMLYRDSVQMNWLFDEARKSGDSAVLEDTEGSTYYVALFNDRKRSDALDYNVRHILVNDKNLELPEGEKATDEQILAKAQEILASWDGTEEGFANLAKENSQDGNAAAGGIYENVVKGQMVAEFEDWCYENGRKAGDTGIVKTQFGQHIMYFVGYGETPYWKSAVTDRLTSDAFSEWEEALVKDVTAEPNESGMKLVG